MLGSSFMFANMPHMLADREVPYAADGIHPSILAPTSQRRFLLRSFKRTRRRN